MLKNSLLLLLLLHSIFAFGQLYFNNAPVDSITIRSEVGAYQFDKKGTFQGKMDVFTITPQPQEKFLTYRYTNTRYKLTRDPATNTNKNHLNRLKKSETPSTEEVQLLLDALQTNMSSEMFFEQIHEIPLTEYVSLKKMKRIARKQDAGWKFKSKYTDKEELEELLKGCISTDTFKIFINKQIQKGDVISSDFVNTFKIWIYTPHMTYYILSDHTHPSRQPWTLHSDSTNIFGKRVLNFEINKALLKLLPSSFMHRKSLLSESMYHSYLYWYLGRREYIQMFFY